MAKTTINTAALHSALDAARQERQISWRALAGEIGVSPSLLRLPAEDFFEHEGERDANDDREPDLMAQLAPLLRARKDLSETDVKYLQQVIGATIERARAQG